MTVCEVRLFFEFEPSKLECCNLEEMQLVMIDAIPAPECL